LLPNGVKHTTVPNVIAVTVALGLLLAMTALSAAAYGQNVGGAQAPATTPGQTGTPTAGGGVSPDAPAQPLPPVPGAKAKLASDGRTAMAPAQAPQQVKDAIAAANRITRKPYRYGGGHRRFNDRAYDCSGAVSYALRGAGLVKRPFDSRGFMRWGESGPGSWITVYTNPGHAYVVIAGLRFDTSGRGEKGPRWRSEARSARGYRARHVEGL
jgi:cell wall-associated NlpC family hydrolase